MACGTQPETVNVELQTAEETPADEKTAEIPDDEVITGTAATITHTLTEKEYEQVFDDIKAFVENLNVVIRNKNYSKWRDALSEERFNEISSPQFLADANKTNSMRRQGIVLKNAYDYFMYVVVPSRANSHVDKIEVLDNNRVRVLYTFTRKTVLDDEERTETVQLLVYELAKKEDSWTIIR
jgi:hypothetical protein